MTQILDFTDRAIRWMSGARSVSTYPAYTVWAHMMGVSDFHVAQPEDINDVVQVNDLLQCMPEWRHRMPELARFGKAWKKLAPQWDRLYEDPGAILGLVTPPRRTAAEKLLKVSPFFGNSGPKPDWQTLKNRYAGMTFEQRVCDWIVGPDTGSSSTSIWRHMIGIRYPSSRISYPHDPADLGRCLRLLELFPEWKGRISEMDEAGDEWASLSDRWEELASSMSDEVGINWEKARSAPETYELMKTVLAEGRAQKGPSP